MPKTICQNCKKNLETDAKVGFREECPFCKTDLHSCVHCQFYDLSAYSECHETSADRVLEKQKANYCDYFSVKTAGADSATNPSDDIKKKLADLFK